MSIQDQLSWLTSNSTVIWIEDYAGNNVVSGKKNDVDRYNLDQGTPISFSQTLEPLWQKKFDNFGDRWNIEREKYRILYDTMRAFFASHIGLRLNKVSIIQENPKKDNLQLKLDLAGSHLHQMYMSGKKTIDLLHDLNLIQGNDFIKLFSETRNKLFEHNHNPRSDQIPDLILEPSLWDIIATRSTMTIYIHTKVEREYNAYIDYYQDYYDLEKVLTNYISVKSFNIVN